MDIYENQGEPTIPLRRQQQQELLDIYNLVPEMTDRVQARSFLCYKRSQLEPITAYLYHLEDSHKSSPEFIELNILELKIH